MWTKENINSLQGKTAIVTGANSGIGFQTALALYEAGAHVVVATRNNANAAHAIEEMKKRNGSGSLETGVIDLASLDSVHAFADSFRSRHSKLDILINNAGVMIPPAATTAEGYELQFGINFVGHFSLTGLLYPALASTHRARIVTVTSLAYTSGSIDFANLRLEKEYDAQREYSQSKLADIMFAIELQDRITAKADTVLSLAAHPGVTKTELSRNMTKEAYDNAVAYFGELMTSEQGALSTLFAATSPLAIPGALYGPDADGGLRGYPAKATIATNALDKTIAGKLWAITEKATGIKFL